jgi:hypothetical protein
MELRGNNLCFLAENGDKVNKSYPLIDKLNT